MKMESDSDWSTEAEMTPISRSATTGRSPPLKGSNRPAPSRARKKPQWEVNSACFDPILDNRRDLAEAAASLQRELADDTWVYSLRRLPEGDGGRGRLQAKFLGDAQLAEALKNAGDSNFDMIAISECLREDQGKIPSYRQKRLAITLPSLNALALSFGIPFNFMQSLCRSSSEVGTSFRRLSDTQWDYWCMLPFRNSHAYFPPARHDFSERAYSVFPVGSDVDPNSALRLDDKFAELLKSRYGVYVRYDKETDRSSAVVIHQQANLSFKSFEAPIGGLEEVLGGEASGEKSGPLMVLLVYIGAALREWSTSLFEFNEQLVRYDCDIQADATRSYASFNNQFVTNLPIMAAHLHRYHADLGRINAIIDEVTQRLDVMSPQNRHRDEDRLASLKSRSRSQLLLCEELERKIRDLQAANFHNKLNRSVGSIEANTDDGRSATEKIYKKVTYLSAGLRTDLNETKAAIMMILAFLVGAGSATLFSTWSSSSTPYRYAYGGLYQQSWWPSSLTWFIVMGLATGVMFQVFRKALKFRQEGGMFSGFFADLLTDLTKKSKSGRRGRSRERSRGRNIIGSSSLSRSRSRSRSRFRSRSRSRDRFRKPSYSTFNNNTSRAPQDCLSPRVVVYPDPPRRRGRGRDSVNIR